MPPDPIDFNPFTPPGAARPHQAPSPTPDPTYLNCRREAVVILAAWAVSTVYCCTYAYLYGYPRPGHPLGPEDIRPILGMPSWIFWGVMAPWAAFAVFIVWFAGFRMADDDLGDDHAAELDLDIREEGEAEAEAHHRGGRHDG